MPPVTLVLFIAGLLLSARCAALPDDSQAPVQITADFADFNHRQGIALYRGQVEISQGSRQFSGDTVRIYLDTDNQVEKIVAIGAPATFQHLPKAGAAQAVATARRIEFEARTDQLLLLDNARIWRVGGEAISSQRMVYHTETSRLESGPAPAPDAAPAPNSSTGRVRITLPGRN